MKKIFYRTLTIEGFQKIIDKFEFKLDLPGITIFNGNNGIGKTTLISAFIWAQFGITAKKSNTPDPWKSLTKSKKYIGTRVTIEFTQDKSKYILTRCKDYRGEVNGIKPGRGLYISLTKDGEELITTKDKGNAQAIIEDVIGYTSHLYLNSIIFCQKAIRVLGMGGSDRKNLFEDIFEVSFIEDAIEKAKSEYNQLNLECSKLEQDIIIAKGDLDLLEITLGDLRKAKKDYLEEREKFLEAKSLCTEIRKTKPEEIDISDILKKQGEINKKIEDAYDELDKHSSKRDYLKYKCENIKKDIKRREQEAVSIKVQKNCPTCGQPLPKDNKMKDKLKSMKEAIDGLYKNLEEEENNYKKALSLVEEYKEKLEKYRKKSKAIDKDNAEAIELNHKRELAEYKIADAHNKMCEHQSKLKKLRYTFSKSDIKNTKAKIKEKTESLSELEEKLKSSKEWAEAYYWVIQDPLSNKGIKPYILQSLITQLNKIVSQYSSIVGFQVIIDFDLNSVSKAIDTIIAFPDGSIAKYEELSGGQQQLADLVILLSINKLRNTTRPLNLMFLDELFEHLSEENINKVFGIIQNSISKEDSIFIVTHNDEFKPQGTNLLYFSSPSPGKLSLERL